ncbi:MAG TPA: invasion associated locus B family protein [Xanthobacteraceae bacterium]|nr:invasion associated locus B family protein [Xanthobacteraceae bacterium]
MTSTQIIFSRPLTLLVALALSLAAAVSPARTQGSEGQPSLVERYGDWGVYVGSNDGKKVCFALTQPTSSETDPPNRPRDPIYLFVSTRPAENVRHEVSIIIGYPHKPNADATAEVGDAKFAMQTQSDNAWVKNPAEEESLVASMRKGADMVVRGVSSRGTETTDRYSLKGVSQALDRVSQECR